MGQVRVGFFQAFKSSDTLLIDGDNDGLRSLASALRKLATTNQGIAIHNLPFVEIHDGLQVLASCANLGDGAAFQHPGVITWTRSAAGWEEAADKIAVLSQHPSGHQYLDDLSDITVMASTGEYGDAWWQRLE